MKHKLDPMVAFTGSRGLLGTALRRELEREEVAHCPLGRSDWDMLADPEPPTIGGIEVLIHCADYYPGLEATAAAPFEVWLRNCQLYERLFSFAERNQVSRVVTIGTTACYPVIDEPLQERWIEQVGDFSLLNQKMLGYAASRYSLLDLSALARSRGIEHRHLILPNFYGPGDKYERGRSHLLSSWTRDFTLARDRGEPIELWGSPEVCREFIYTEDAARYTLALARAEQLDHEIYNVGYGLAPSYGELAEAICELIGFSGSLSFDRSRPNVRQREVMDCSRLQASGVTLPEPTSFAAGLAATVSDFQARYPQGL